MVKTKKQKKSHDRTDYAETKEKEPGKYGEPGGFHNKAYI